jgi:hypothetical protein
MIPVEVTIDGVRWETSLFPQGGGYVVPIKAAVRARLGLTEGDAVTIGLEVAVRGGRQLSERDRVDDAQES